MNPTFGALQNQVLFEAGTESFHVLHRTIHYGQAFKILGCVYDPQLLMHSAARRIAHEAGWQFKTLLASQRFLTLQELMRLYKAQILLFIESSAAALHNAAPSALERVDRVQARFLRELGLTSE